MFVGTVHDFGRISHVLREHWCLFLQQTIQEKDEAMHILAIILIDKQICSPIIIWFPVAFRSFTTGILHDGLRLSGGLNSLHEILNNERY